MSALLGLRLALGSGREGAARLLLVAISVGLGVTVLLLGLAMQAALRERDARMAWQHSGESHPGIRLTPPAPDQALWLGVTDGYAGRPIFRIHVAALGPRPPVPRGLERLPAPGEVAVSPALARMLAATPDERLGARFPGRITATIGPEGLRDPDQLVAVVGHSRQELARHGGAEVVRGLARYSSGYVFATGLPQVALGLGMVLLLGPMVVLIVMVTRVAAVRREQRVAAIRLAGATRTQAAVMAGAETAVGAVLGSVLGALGYLAVRALVADDLSYQDARFFPEDVATPPLQGALVLAGMPLLAVLVTILTSRRARVAPLSISRLAHRPPPRLWRILLPLAGIAGLLFAGRQRDSGLLAGGRVEALVSGSLQLTMLGIVIAGPAVCLLAGRILARAGRHAASLLAARRIQADPRGASRAVSGVLLAAFAATFLAGFVTAARDRTAGSFGGGLRPGVVEVYTGTQITDQRLAPLLAMPGVVVSRSDPGRGVLVVRCADLSRVVLTGCPAPRYGDASTAGLAVPQPPVEPGPGTERLPVHAIYVPTDGSPAAEERVRTRAAALVPRAIVNTPRDRLARDVRVWNDVDAAVRVVTLFVVLVAGGSLTVSVAAGLIERRRPFALLRAGGARPGQLRRVLLTETAVPMAATVTLGAAFGLAASYGFWDSRGRPWPAPDLGLAVLLGGGVLSAMVVTLLTLPMVNAATGYDAVRYE